MTSPIETRARFDIVRYAQVWEDADLLIDALALTSSDTALSIASAGDNAFAMAAQGPAKVYAIDLNASQIACCELRKAMYRQLPHREHLLLGGVISGDMDRAAVFNRLVLPRWVREYWEHNIGLIEKGFMTQGKFERYFALFRKRVLPLIHSRREVAGLIAPKSRPQRDDYYTDVWNNLRWKVMFRVFFSRFVMGRLGRDKGFFDYVEGHVAQRILARAKHALTALDTAQNPYLHFILNGSYDAALPYALREENYGKIRANLDRIVFDTVSIERFIAEHEGVIDAFNLSDIFEYMTQESMDALYSAMLNKSARGARFAYWNMLAPRRCSDALCACFGVISDDKRNEEYLMRDKAFFYSAFRLDALK